MEELTQLLFEASENRRMCRVQLRGEPLTRVIHPYGICKTTTNKIVVVCWQSLGFTKPGGTAGFRNLILDECEEIEMMESFFTPNADFNPRDIQYKEWVYHI